MNVRPKNRQRVAWKNFVSILVFVCTFVPKEAWVARYPDETNSSLQFKGKAANEIATALGFKNQARELTIENSMAREEKNKKLRIQFDPKTEVITFKGGWMISGTGLFVAEGHELFATVSLDKGDGPKLVELLRKHYSMELGDARDQKKKFEQRVNTWETYFKENNLDPDPEVLLGGPPADTPESRSYTIFEKHVTGLMGKKLFMLKADYLPHRDGKEGWPVNLILAVKGFDVIK